MVAIAGCAPFDALQIRLQVAGDEEYASAQGVLGALQRAAQRDDEANLALAGAVVPLAGAGDASGIAGMSKTQARCARATAPPCLEMPGSGQAPGTRGSAHHCQNPAQRAAPGCSSCCYAVMSTQCHYSRNVITQCQD